MSAVAHPSALAGSRNGGVAARRAVTRWARRMFRREWRQQLLVVTLLTVAVAAAIAALAAVIGLAMKVLYFDPWLLIGIGLDAMVLTSAVAGWPVTLP